MPRERSSQSKESQRFSYILSAPNSIPPAKPLTTIPTMEEVLNGRLFKKKKYNVDLSEAKYRVNKEKHKIKSSYNVNQYDSSPQPPKLPRLPTIKEVLNVNRRVKVAESQEEAITNVTAFHTFRASQTYSSQTLPLMEEVLNENRFKFEVRKEKCSSTLATFTQILSAPQFSRSHSKTSTMPTMEEVLNNDLSELAKYQIRTRSSKHKAKEDSQMSNLSIISTVRKVKKMENGNLPTSTYSTVSKVKVENAVEEMDRKKVSSKATAKLASLESTITRRAKGTPNSASSKDSSLHISMNHNSKPNYSYSSLIGQALMQAPKRTLALADIYNWISDTYPFYKKDQDGWKNSVRHNLSLNSAFIRVPRQEDKLHCWTINNEEDHCFKDGVFTPNKKSHKGNKRPRVGVSSQDSSELKIINSDYSRGSGSAQTVDVYYSDSTILDSDSGLCECTMG